MGRDLGTSLPSPDDPGTVGQKSPSKEVMKEEHKIHRKERRKKRSKKRRNDDLLRPRVNRLKYIVPVMVYLPRPTTQGLSPAPHTAAPLQDFSPAPFPTKVA